MRCSSPLSVALDDLEVLALIDGERPGDPFAQQLGQRQHRVERRPDLVAHVGDEGVLEPIDLLDLARLRLQLGARRLELPGPLGHAGLDVRRHRRLGRLLLPIPHLPPQVELAAVAGWPLRPLSRISPSASRKSGWRKAYPVSIVRTGMARWLASRSSSVIAPNARRSANAGARQRRRAPQRLAQRAHELTVGDRLGRHQVERPLHRFVRHRVADEADLVVEVDPGHPLGAAADLAAQAQAKRRQDLAQDAPVARQHEAAAQEHHAHADLGRLHRLGLPVAPQLGDEPLTERRGLGQDLVAAIAVVPHARRRDEDARSLRQPPQDVDERARPDHPAVAQPLLARLGPASAGDRLADQVDDHVDPFERRLGRRRAGGVPGVQLCRRQTLRPRLVSRTSAATLIPSRAQEAASAVPTSPVAPVIATAPVPITRRSRPAWTPG